MYTKHKYIFQYKKQPHLQIESENRIFANEVTISYTIQYLISQNYLTVQYHFNAAT